MYMCNTIFNGGSYSHVYEASLPELRLLFQDAGKDEKAVSYFSHERAGGIIDERTTLIVEVR